MNYDGIKGGSMITFDFDGLALTHQRVAPGDTLATLSSGCYTYKCYRLNVDDADTQFYTGAWLEGQSSGAIAKVVYISMSAWTNGTGYVIVDSWNGTAYTDNEELGVAAGTTNANVNQPAAWREATDEEYSLAGRAEYRGLAAKSALVVVYANTALVDWTGGRPDQTNLIGTPMVANSSVKLKSYNEIANFKCIDYTSGSASIVQVKFYF